MIDWKSGERKIAAILGGERIPVNGRRGVNRPSDIVSSWLVCEAKTAKRLPVYLAKAISQAVAGELFHRKRDGKRRLAVAVFHQDGERYDEAILAMRLADFVEWFGSLEGHSPDVPIETPSANSLTDRV